MAEKLMTKYGLTMGELEAITSPIDECDADGVPIGKQRCHEVRKVSNAIAYYTGTETWYQMRGIIQAKRWRAHEHRGALLIYFGLPTDVQVAIYLTTTLRLAMDYEWAAYWKAHKSEAKSSPRTVRLWFMRGMAKRLSSRLREMKNAQGRAAPEDSRAIVLTKERIVNEAFNSIDWVARMNKRRPSYRGGPFDFRIPDQSAVNAGMAAGDRVTIAKGALQ
jgi:hypothetical protein